MKGREQFASRIRALAQRATTELDGAEAIDVIRWVDENLAGSYVVASSMKDAVLIDLAAQVRPGVHVMFVDTGYHFVETLGMRAAVAAQYDVTVIDVRPDHTPAEQDALLGKDLFVSQPDECCRLRKVLPMSRALRGYCAWLTGIRRSDSVSRTHTPMVSYDERFGVLKVNPLVEWTDDRLQKYVTERGILVNPLVYEGYPSIGCAPCTALPQDGADSRSGRWVGHGKSECGLHAS